MAERKSKLGLCAVPPAPNLRFEQAHTTSGRSRTDGDREEGVLEHLCYKGPPYTLQGSKGRHESPCLDFPQEWGPPEPPTP